MLKPDRAEHALQLMQKAFSLLEEDKLEEAQKIGQELKKLRHSSAFEILALVYLRQEKIQRAVSVLEEGTRKAGKVWILWELLGNCYSDLGRFQDAERAYQYALQQPGCDPSVVHLNRAIAFERSGKITDANTAVRQVKAKGLQRRRDAVRIRLALAERKTPTAQDIARKMARSRRSSEGNYDKETESSIMLSCALAFQATLETRITAVRYAHRAVDLFPSNMEALALIREARARKTTVARLYRLLIHGDWDAPLTGSESPLGFYRTIQVVAPTEATAFKYAKQFFPTAVRRTLKLEEHTFRKSPDLDLEGVYYLSGYAFYDKRDET